MNIEQAKKLLKKGRELGDEDLINMALEILGVETESQEPVISEVIVETPKSPKELPDFTMKKNPVTNGKKAARPESIGGFVNNWVDEGEHKDIVTPAYTPTPRVREEVKPQKLKCAECGRVVEQIIIHSMQAEFYRCPNCRSSK